MRRWARWASGRYLAARRALCDLYVYLHTQDGGGR